MATRLSKDMPTSDVSAFVRNLATELKKDPEAGTRLAKEIVREFAKSSYEKPATTPSTPEQEQRLRKLFGKKLQELRKDLGITGTELARRTQCSQAYIWRMEQGDSEPSLIVLRRLAKVLGVKLAVLLDAYEN